MERNDAITTLEVLKANCSKHSRDYQALEYTINSLKTDKAYQIMYEGGEIYTKADIVAMLTEIQTEIKKLNTYDIERTHGLIEDAYISKEADNIIQQKINELKGTKDGNK